GGELAEAVRSHGEAGGVVLKLEDLTLTDAFENIDLQVRQGEIVGLYGLVGSGAAEVGDVSYGMRRPSSGTVRSKDDARPISSPAHAKRRGVRMLPANRGAQGTFSFQPIAFNITVGSLHLLSRAAGWVSPRIEQRIADDLIGRLSVKTPSARQPVS